MLVFNDKGKLKKRIKELEEALSEAALNEEKLRKLIKRLEADITSMERQHKADKERLAEQLEFYEKGLLRRDLAIAELEKTANKAENAYGSLLSLNESISKKLHEASNMLLELESTTNHPKEELHDGVTKLDGHKPSKKPYPTVTINVDVRDTLTKQLAKSLKQVNEAFEKRSKEKRYIFSCEGLDYSSENRTELARCIDSMYKLSLHDYASLVRLLESLEKELEHKDFANGGRSFYSNKLQERVFITLKATKEEI